jgi:hypothetical protein
MTNNLQAVTSDRFYEHDLTNTLQLVGSERPDQSPWTFPIVMAIILIDLDSSVCTAACTD